MPGHSITRPHSQSQHYPTVGTPFRTTVCMTSGYSTHLLLIAGHRWPPNSCRHVLRSGRVSQGFSVGQGLSQYQKTLVSPTPVLE